MSGHDEQTDLERELWERLRPAPLDHQPCIDPLALAAYVDGRAPEDETARIERHLAACPHCLEALTETRALLAEGPMLVPQAMLDRAKALIPAPQEALRLAAQEGTPLAARRHMRRPWRLVRWAAAAAAAMLVSYAGFHTGSVTRQGRVDQSAALASEAFCGLADPWGQPTLDADELLALAEGRP